MRNTFGQIEPGQTQSKSGCGCGCGSSPSGKDTLSDVERISLEERQRDLEQELSDIVARLDKDNS